MLAVFILLAALIIPLLILGVAGAAFTRLGFTWVGAVAVIILMLAGSFVNIPLYSFRAPPAPAEHGGASVFDAFTGDPVPDQRSHGTVSLNLGGGVIPIIAGIHLISLLYAAGRPDAGAVALPVAACFFPVAVVTFFSATVLPTGGLRAPLLLPALAALGLGLLFGGGTGLTAGVTAFAGGTLGILTGATARGLTTGIRLGVRQVSIGGSGMFGTVFLCTLLSALIA